MSSMQGFYAVKALVTLRGQIKSPESFCGYEEDEFDRPDHYYVSQLKGFPNFRGNKVSVYLAEYTRQTSGENREEFKYFYIGVFTKGQAQLLKTIEANWLDIIARGGPVEDCRLEGLPPEERRKIYVENVTRYLKDPDFRESLLLEPRPRNVQRMLSLDISGLFVNYPAPRSGLKTFPSG